jgi:aminoglycoside 2'-N-acetyltransferase I
MASGQAQPKLSVAHVDLLSTAERDEIVSLCGAACDKDAGQLFAPLPGSMHVRAWLDGHLVGHACWVTGWLQPEGLALLGTAYVEAVAVDPGHQRRGIDERVMRRLTIEIQDDDLAALLPAVESFYERLGWELWGGPTAIRTEDGLLPTPYEDIMILRTPRTPPLDLNARIPAEWRVGDMW